MKEGTVSRVAIVLLALVMLTLGIYHFINPQSLVVFIPSFLPKGNLWIYIPGAAFILAAIAFITNRMVKLAAYLLAVLLFIFAITIHLPGFLNAGDAETRTNEFLNFLKDIAIATFALHIAANSPN